MKTAFRSWRRTPGSALLIVLAFGLSGGALLTLVSLLNALFWRELPVAEPGALVGIFGTDQRRPDWINVGLPASLFTAIAEGQQVFDVVAGEDRASLTVVVGGSSQRLSIEGVTADYFDTLGLSPALGRHIQPVDVEDAAAVVVISSGLWQRQFGADPGVLGQTMRMRGEAVTVVGVASAAFTGLEAGWPTDAWMPVSIFPRVFEFPASAQWFDVLVGRLRPGVTLEEAQPQLESLWERARQAAVAEATPAGQTELLALEPRIRSAARGFSQYGAYYRRALMWLVIASLITIILACANLSGLLLARWSAREAELDVRAALGASNGRLVRQVVGEALALSSIAVVLSAPFALWSAKSLTLLLWDQPAVLPLELSPDLRVFGVMILLAAIVALSVSLLPAIRIWCSRPGLMRATRGLPGGGATRWGRRLAAAQVALSVPLLVTAWVVAANLHRLASATTGFEPDTVVAAGLGSQSGTHRTGDLATYFRQVTSTLRAVPGITSVALSDTSPIAGIGVSRRRPITSDDGVLAQPFVVAASPGYFDTLGVNTLAGRDFTWTDDSASGDVAVISAGLAQAVFGSDDPIGRRLRIDDGTDRAFEVVGVVADANLAEPHQMNQVFLFTSFMQLPQRLLEQGSLAVLLQSPLSPGAIEPVARRAVAALGQDDIIEARSLQRSLEATLLSERVMRLGAFYFAGLTTLLVFVGLFAVLNLGVVRRIPEIGLRLALGATTGDIRMTVIREAIVAAAAGLVVGLPLAFACGRLVASSLTLAGPHEAMAFGGAIALILVICTLSVLIPLRRASRVTPLEALANR